MRLCCVLCVLQGQWLTMARSVALTTSSSALATSFVATFDVTDHACAVAAGATVPAVSYVASAAQFRIDIRGVYLLEAQLEAQYSSKNSYPYGWEQLINNVWKPLHVCRHPPPAVRCSLFAVRF